MGRAHRKCDRCGELKRSDKMATALKSNFQFCKHCNAAIAQNRSNPLLGIKNFY